MSGRVIVVGSVNVDLVVTGERLPVARRDGRRAGFERHHGGKGGNQAVAAARLGGRSCRRRRRGRRLRRRGARRAAREGVACLVPDHARGRGHGGRPDPRRRRGENLISVAPGANAGLEAALVRAALGRLDPTGDVVLVGHELPTGAAREALRLGRAAGAWTILNPAPAGGLDRTVLGGGPVTPNRGELPARRRRGAADRAAPAGRRRGRPPGGPGVPAALVSEGPGVARRCS